MNNFHQPGAGFYRRPGNMGCDQKFFTVSDIKEGIVS